MKNKTPKKLSDKLVLENTKEMYYYTTYNIVVCGPDSRSFTVRKIVALNNIIEELNTLDPKKFSWDEKNTIMRDFLTREDFMCIINPAHKELDRIKIIEKMKALWDLELTHHINKVSKAIIKEDKTPLSTELHFKENYHLYLLLEFFHFNRSYNTVISQFLYFMIYSRIYREYCQLYNTKQEYLAMLEKLQQLNKKFHKALGYIKVIKPKKYYLNGVKFACFEEKINTDSHDKDLNE